MQYAIIVKGSIEAAKIAAEVRGVSLDNSTHYSNWNEVSAATREISAEVLAGWFNCPEKQPHRQAEHVTYPDGALLFYAPLL